MVKTRLTWRLNASLLGAFAVLPVLGMAGCEVYPDSDRRFDDEVIATGYDKKADFAGFKTFAVDPTVYLVKGLSDGGIEEKELDSEYADPIVARVVENMKDRGYEEVDVEDDPDLGITLTGVNALVTGTVSWWWGFGGYWGYPGWGYYYPYYYSYSYRTGSLVTEMVDLTRATLPEDDAGIPEDGKPIGLPVVWSSVGYKVLNGNVVPDVTWAEESIDQAFKQSPYLGSK